MGALPSELTALSTLSNSKLVTAILERRGVIRYVRDQVGDDRCFLDYYLIWGLVEGSSPMPRFSAKEGMKLCQLFHENCGGTKDEIPGGLNCVLDVWDTNLLRVNRLRLLAGLVDMQFSIIYHRDVESIEGRKRKTYDDKILYRKILPEKISGDFSLPPREKFLVSQSDHSGCPAFWQSHASCGEHCDLHQWGPCKAPSGGPE